MDAAIEAFLQQNRSAAMVTLRADGTPHVARIGVALVDGKIWSSGTQARVRTKNLRRDNRSTLFVFEPAWRWLGLECTVAVLDGPEAPELNLRLFRVMQENMPPPTTPGNLTWMGSEKTPEEFLRIMVEEQRLIYEFDVRRAYGMYGEMLAGR
jgi:hypothetical protein